LVAALLVPTLAAQADPPPLEAGGTHGFVADLLVFYEQDADDALVWLSVNVPLSSLFFEPGSTASELLVSWKVRRGSKQVDGDVMTRRVVVAEEMREDRNVLQVIPVRLAPGRYTVEIEVGQPGGDHRSRVARELRIEPAENTPLLLSSLYLSAEAPKSRTGSTSSPPAFPLVGRIVNEGLGTLRVIGELYAPEGCTERYRVGYRLVDDLERTLQERTEEIPCEGFRTMLDLPLDTGSLSFGDFRVEVSVKVPKEGHELYRELWFSADESLLSMKAGYPRSLEIIEAIATDEELQKLKDAAPNERKDAWEAFWASRDPDPDTKANEARLDFFRRVRFANQHFGTALQPGWRSDRGRVLLEHGHPDQIDRNPSSPGQPSLEIWRYTALRLEFRFVDETGLGEYRLVSRL